VSVKVVTLVGYPSDVREVVLGDEGVLTTARNGSTIVDMTTSEPLLAQEIFEAAAAKGVGSLDAPVSGGGVGARNASLVIMVGGSQEAFGQARRERRQMRATVPPRPELGATFARPRWAKAWYARGPP
jgi:3-hydroxyisobutyrate dehydrogenase-like beta-hydroxyacid dehydrogenase